MKGLIFLILISFGFVSCMKQDETEIPQVSQPKHFVFGKWKSVGGIDKSSPFILNFRDNSLLIIDTFIKDKNVYTHDYVFSIIDDSTVKFYFTKTINNESVSILIKAKNNSEIELNCFNTDRPEEKITRDTPTLCFYNNFRKIDE